MTELPSGTVTFLLTDVEGSTALWEEAPEAMRAALARHDALLRVAILEHGGHVVKTTGDGFHAAFARAPDAVAAALAAQRRLLAEPWGEVGPVRARMALHTGVAEERDGDYYGPALNRVARLLAAGHGGQTLLSEATAGLVRDDLPPGVSLRDLGEHRFKDLTRSGRVHQIVAPGLTADFPPLGSLDARLNNLPVQPTPLVGRDREVQAVRDLLLRGDVRLVTLTGPGGTGKTRLGLQVAADLLDHFPGGVFFVSLAPISDPGLVVPTVAQTLGLREIGGRSLRDTVAGFLREKRLLLLLDNFEQILSAAPLVADLLSACPDLKVLITSRARLRLRGEHEFAVPPLALPDGQRGASVQVLGQYAAVTLFVQRAAEAMASFGLTDENAPTVAEICRRLDGLPLAIELAAARVKLLSSEALLRRLERRLPLLTGGARDLPVRQRTLRDAVGWSYDLLDEADRTLFRRLGVFVGGFTLEAAQVVCLPAADHSIDVLDGISSLADKSLLQRTVADGEPRFEMLETIREFALERLGESGEAPWIRRLHAECFLALAATAWPELTGKDQGAWYARLEADHDNIRAALTWCLATPESAHIGSRLACALYRFWQRHGHVTEGREWLARALSRHDSDDETRARLLNAAGVLARSQGDIPLARTFFEESLAMFRTLGEQADLANALHNLGSTVHFQGDFGLATALLDESLAMWRAIGDRWGLAIALEFRGGLARDQGEATLAMALYEESVGLLRDLGDWWAVASALGNLGILVGSQGHHARAAALFDQRMAIRTELGDPAGAAWSQVFLGRAAYEEGDFDRASRLYRQSLRRYWELGHHWEPIVCLEGLAATAVSAGDPARSAALYGAASAQRDAIEEPVPSRERASHEQSVAAARAALGNEAFASAWAEGRAMTLEQAVAYALDEPPSA